MIDIPETLSQKYPEVIPYFKSLAKDIRNLIPGYFSVRFFPSGNVDLYVDQPDDDFVIVSLTSIEKESRIAQFVREYCRIMNVPFISIDYMGRLCQDWH